MGDDCSNNWGCELAHLNKNVSRSQTMCSTVGENRFSRLATLIDKTFRDEYQLQKVLSCGSDANMHAIMEVTKGDNHSCLIAAGSYVSGDGSPLQGWSTSSFHMNEGTAFITPPDLIANKFTRSHTISLPYAIPGAISERALNSYEDKCFKALHDRCLLAKVKGVPIRCILLELILAANGASLSDRALVVIGQLAEFHNVYIVVDEVMTGGRTGTMLHLQTKPTQFRNRVSHVTLGKWIKVGLLLASKVYLDNQTRAAEEHISKRGVSTFIANNDIVDHWHAVVSTLASTEERRKKVLAKKRIKTNEAWGQGCLIFAPINKQGMIFGLKNRLLPLLDLNTPIDNFVCSKKPGWSKEEVNQNTMQGVESWLKFIPYDETDQDLHELIQLLTTCKERQLLELSTVAKKKFQNFSVKKLSGMLRKAEKAGLVAYELVGAKRVRRWKVADVCFPISSVFK